MVHLILVSHHPALAQALAELAAQVSADPATIHTAAGIDDADNPIGTDAVRIMAAIDAADNPDGILILVDLGSAILSAQTALDLVDPDVAARCRIAAAPFVEGALSAAVAAASGADLATVAREAEGALLAKQLALGVTTSVLATAAAPAGEAATITLTNPHGLHARPAARLVAALAPFAASLTLVKDGQSADPRSLNQLTALQARRGDSLTLYADGADSAAALAAFRDLAAAQFGDIPDHPRIDAGPPLAHAIPVLPPHIRAPLYRYPGRLVFYRSSDDREFFSSLVTTYRHHLGRLQEHISACYGADAGDIFAAQQQLLDELAANTLARPETDILAAWCAETTDAVAQMQALADPYLRARALDIADIADGVLAVQSMTTPVKYPRDKPFILVAPDLYPEVAATLPDNCVAVVLAAGDANSHSAILCRHAARPLYIQAGEDVLTLPNGTLLTITPDGTLNPQPQEQP
ncbi:dihydroxyacetone kinase phosphoryl donor subunit DhaM [uncultured Cardiobacterium sp.]|uniref:dihydroxyacetone kinase phosphoryl donor subunit DhaM n=1 Tax=uncultured Cardiobacterium sp. TaxID=417619 RepID=UPI00262B40B1|nr:dihydroxyacetone kinase phosphoryl donor subunit DhaM [uncultured Cardiobacterium sp.]